MIKYVDVNGHTKPAIVVNCIDDISQVRELRKALIDVMETCLSSDQTKEYTSSTSLWYLTRLIDETTVECPNEKGGDG